MKDFSFIRFFNPQKSMGKKRKGTNQAKKNHGHLVWDSKKKGTYTRSENGELK